jgi:hypothetical protein
MNANDLAKKAKENRQRLDAEKRAREKAEDTQREKEREKAVVWEINDRQKRVEKQILDAVGNGQDGITVRLGNVYRETIDTIKEDLKKQDFLVQEERVWVEADNGDPNSGEGRCNAHSIYYLKISWKK